jgi:hypothetical protein
MIDEQRQLLWRFLYSSGYEDIARRVLEVDTGEGRALPTDFLNKDFFEEYWDDEVDSWGRWSSSWAGHNLLSEISQLEGIYVDDWIEFLAYSRVASKPKTLTVSPEEASELATKILATKDLTLLADLFDWKSSPEGFHYWYELVKTGSINSGLNIMLQSLIKKPQPEEEGAREDKPPF